MGCILQEKERLLLAAIASGQYRVTRQGQILNLKMGHELGKENKRPGITLNLNGKNYPFTKARIVWLTFFGPVPDNMLVVAKDGSKNFAADNLECISAHESRVRQYKVGLKTSHGLGSIVSKMSDDYVVDLRKRYAEKPFDLRPIQKEFGFKLLVSIKNAITGVSYQHLTTPAVANVLSSYEFNEVKQKPEPEPRQKPGPKPKPKPKPIKVKKERVRAAPKIKVILPKRKPITAYTPGRNTLKDRLQMLKDAAAREYLMKFGLTYK